MQISPTVPQTFEKILSVVADKGYPTLRIRLRYSLLLPFAIDPSIDFSQVIRLLEIYAPAQDHTELNENDGRHGGEGQVMIEVESSLSKIRPSGRSDPTEDGAEEKKIGWVVERVRDWFAVNAGDLSLESVGDLTSPPGSSSLDPVLCTRLSFFRIYPSACAYMHLFWPVTTSPVFVKPFHVPNCSSSKGCPAKPRAILQKIHIQIQWDHRGQPRTKKRKPRGIKNRREKRGKIEDEGNGYDEEQIRIIKTEESGWNVRSRTTSPELQVDEDLVKKEQDNHLILYREIFELRRGFLCGVFSSEVPPSVVRTFDRALYKLIRTHLHRSLPLIFDQKDTSNRALEVPMFRSVAKSMLSIIERAGKDFRQEAKGLFKDIQAAHQIQKSSFEQALYDLKLGSDCEPDGESDDLKEDYALAASTFETEISQVLHKISLGVKPPRMVQLLAPPLPTTLTPRSVQEVETDRPCFKAEPYENLGSISDFDSDSDSDSDSISDFGLDLESGWAAAPLLHRRVSIEPKDERLIEPRIKEEAVEVVIMPGIRVKIEEDEWGPGLHHISARSSESNTVVPKVEVDDRVNETEMEIKMESVTETADLTVGDLPAVSSFWDPSVEASDETVDHQVCPTRFRPVNEKGEERLSTFFRRSLLVVGPTGFESEGCEDSEESEKSGARDEHEEEDESADDGMDWGWSN